MDDAIAQRQLMLLKKLSNIPRNIAQLQDRHNLVEFVFHELCHEDCLNVHKAAFFVDNQDFNCLHGVVGIDKAEPFSSANIWQAPDDFSDYMKAVAFNEKVRKIQCASDSSLSQPESALIKQLGKELGMNNPKYCLLPLKYDNKGIFLYETSDKHAIEEADLINGLSFLFMCPLF